MVQPPSTIIVVRHGARLDAADRNWHLTSPAPYDPPLTYGGWNQAKALGARIAGILHDRAIAPAANGQGDSAGDEGATHSNGTGPNGQFKKKQKVIIHSSPFLRCLQTSVAIGAGISQYSDASYLKRRKSNHRGLQADSATIPELDEDEYSVKAIGENSPDQGAIKTVMRVDAFLGEWLTPGYFESITPPPNSTMMVASAKAHLLRREQLEVFKPSTTGHGHFPGGWSKPNARQVSAAATSAIDEMAEESHHPPHHLRSSSQNVTGRDGSRSAHRPFNPLESTLIPSDAGYIPPIPTYAIAPSDPIPRGYCVHARDACTDIDLHWDSMRQPQDWGDGGEFGEEWSAMHKRFRTGLYKMNAWYKEHPPEFHPEKEDPLALRHDDDYGHDDEDHDDEEYELVLLVVTHAAGCNALMGALTNQPVLMDFALTSLSMAVRKQVTPLQQSKANGRNTSPMNRRRSSVDFGLAEEYEVKLMSSITHLRAADVTKGATLQSPHLVPQIPEFRQRSAKTAPRAMGAALNGDFNNETRRSVNSSLGSVRRSSLTPTPASSYRTSTGSPGSTVSRSSSGLWSKVPTTPASLDGMQELSIGSPAHTRPGSSNEDRPILSNPFQTVSQQKEEREARTQPIPPGGLGRSNSQNAGLWGVNAPGERKATDHVPNPKRRWTLHEEEDGHYLE